MPWHGPDFAGDFPTLGHLTGHWIEQHVVVPDGYLRGQPYRLTDEQWTFLLHFYRLYPRAAPWPAPDGLLYTGGQLRRAQKWGKDPFGAALILAEALGPTRFEGWATDDRDDPRNYRPGYDGEARWVRIRPGDPIGSPYPTPLIVCLGTSEEQTANTWRPLLSMVRNGPLIELPGIDVGETRIKLPGGGDIEPVSTSATARLGAPLTFLTITEALALDTPLPTPTGWTTMGAVEIGDELVGRDGRPTRVIGATDVQMGRDCYRVTFADGTSVVASDGHLWWTRVNGSAAKPKERTTREMVEDGRVFRVPVPRLLDGPPVELPIPAYTLGLWIGDGDARTAALTVGEQDLDEIVKLLGDDGCTTAVRPPKRVGGTARTVRFNHGTWYAKRGVTSVGALRSMGLLGNKHIPQAVLRGSYAQRFAFLQGLMDSDGCATKLGHCQFSTNQRHIAHAVLELLRSLGQVPRLSRQEDGRSRTGEMFKVWFAPHDIVPFRLERKAQRCVRPAPTSRASGARMRRDWQTIASIEPVDSVPVRCVSVDAEDHLFLAGEGWQPTHNSHLFTLQGGYRRVAGAVKRNVAGMDGRWLELTNAWDPTEGSEAQVTADANDERVYVDTIESRRVENLDDEDALYAELLRQYGDSARERGGWVNIKGRIMHEARSKRHMEADRRRFFLNEIVTGTSSLVDPVMWDLYARPEELLAAGEQICLGFDGSKYNDATSLVACRMSDGRLFQLRTWERPVDADRDWKVPSVEVDQIVTAAFGAYHVGYLYADPWRWQDYLDVWAARWPKRVVEFATNSEQRMDRAIERFVTAFGSGAITHDGTDTLTAHVKSAVIVKGARKKARPGSDDLATHYMKLAKRTDRSWIDGAVASVLAYEARGQAIEDDVFATDEIVLTGRLFGGSDDDD